MAPIYAPYVANKTGFLKVSDLHSIYWEDCGLPTGLPILYLHGGPGGGISDDDRRWFDPTVYRSVLFDQRGAGRSLPHATLKENTTWDLVSDIEKLRTHLGIEKWVVFGGSWGSTLALAYSQKHPERCLGLILRGIFTLRKSEMDWNFQGGGVDNVFPEYFEEFRAQMPVEERGDIMGAYYKRMTGDDEEVKVKCAAVWSKWENCASKLIIDPEYVKKAEVDGHWALAHSRIECHYFVNGGWMKDGQLTSQEEVNKIKHLPIVIIQGRYDMVCPVKSSFDLYQALGGEGNKNVEYHIIPDAGHSAQEPGIRNALVEATNKFRSLKA